jgi:imidazolonepropionase-like amidohydrolase
MTTSNRWCLTSAISVWVVAWIGVTAQGPPATAFLHVNVIDGTGAPLKADQTVVVVNGRIVSIGRAADVPVSDATRQVDGTSKYLIPGLWDAHVHTRSQAIDHLRLSIVNGVTSIRDMGGPWEHLERMKQWRRDIAAGALIGPRIIAAGPMLDGPGARFPVNTQIVKTPEEGREQVRRLKAAGADFVKAYDLLPAETFAAIADEARAQRLPIAGHLPFALAPTDVSNAGYRTLEHVTFLVIPLSSEGDAVSAEIRSEAPEKAAEIMRAAQDRLLRSIDLNRVRALAAAFRRNGTYVVPTLSNGWSATAESRRDGRLEARMRFTPPAYRADFNGTGLGDEFAAMWRRVVDLAGVLHREGVQLITGTDVTSGRNIIGFSLHDELALLVRAGLSPMEAIEAATRNPSRLFGFSDLGTIEVGMQADLVLLDADPLANIENTTRIAAVMAGGRLFDRDALQRMLTEIEQAAARWSGTVTRPR